MSQRHFGRGGGVGGGTWLPCHSTTSFSESVIVTETSYQMLEVLSFFDRERG